MKSMKNCLSILLKIILINLIFINLIFAEDINQKIISIGNYYSQLLMKNLKNELKIAIEKGGVINAIDVCSKKH